MVADGPDSIRLAEILASMDHRIRSRYSTPPPPYSASKETQLQSPTFPDDGQGQQVQEAQDRSNSTVYWQFNQQQHEEEKWILNACQNGEFGGNLNLAAVAKNRVKEIWIKQGIWNRNWTDVACARWKHEEPLQIESESESDSSLETPGPLFGIRPSKPRRPKSDGEKRRIAERLAVQTREREASRPLNQFRFQLCREQERIQDELQRGIFSRNDEAYNRVKRRWQDRGIWKVEWGKYPGMSWKHEEDLDHAATGRPHPVDSVETHLPSPTFPDGKQQAQQATEWLNSTVYWQYNHQQQEEQKRILYACQNGEFGTGPFNLVAVAEKRVKDSWIKQGIWNRNWIDVACARWKHEEPLQIESESESDSSLETPEPLFGIRPNKPRRPKSDGEKRRIAERLAVQTREREASRPLYQFRYQLSREQEWIQNELQRGGLSRNANTDDEAYNRVKYCWKERGIWKAEWGEYPGMSWKHEKALPHAAKRSPHLVNSAKTQLPRPTFPDEQKVREARDRSNSTVYWQFNHQHQEEEKRLLYAWPNGEFGTGPSDPAAVAEKIVKESWIKQGIWNSDWTSLSYAQWKHEEPLQIESESESDSSPERPQPLFAIRPNQPRRIAERLAVQKREREASRPIYQFRFQLSRERERIQEELPHGRLRRNANTKDEAYNRVKARWQKRGIWKVEWGKYPGMSWKHEEDLNGLVRGGLQTADSDLESDIEEMPQIRPHAQEPTANTYSEYLTGDPEYPQNPPLLTRQNKPGSNRRECLETKMLNPFHADTHLRRSEPVSNESRPEPVSDTAVDVPTGSFRTDTHLRRSERLSNKNKSKSLSTSAQKLSADQFKRIPNSVSKQRVAPNSVKPSGISKSRKKGKKGQLGRRGGPVGGTKEA